MNAHVCKIAHYCMCSVVGLEPSQDCPIHGEGQWPPQCITCGRFMKAETRETEQAGYQEVGK